MFTTITTNKTLKELGYMLSFNLESYDMVSISEVTIIELYEAKTQTLSSGLKKIAYQLLTIYLVPGVGLEPTRIAPADFKSAASADSATPA